MEINFCLNKKLSVTVHTLSGLVWPCYCIPIHLNHIMSKPQACYNQVCILDCMSYMQLDLYTSFSNIQGQDSIMLTRFAVGRRPNVSSVSSPDSMHFVSPIQTCLLLAAILVHFCLQISPHVSSIDFATAADDTTLDCLRCMVYS